MFRKRASEPDLSRVDRLQVDALQCRIPGEAAALYNRAGDLLLAAGDMDGAIEQYGRAIDDFVEAERYDAGIALCRKLVRTVPEVVRARCTMTWLAIGAGYMAEAATSVVQYAWSAEFAGRDAVARQHLRHMGVVATERGLRLAVGECLLQLGDEEGADEVFGVVFREQNLPAPPGPAEELRHSARALALVREAALLRPGARFSTGPS